MGLRFRSGFKRINFKIIVLIFALLEYKLFETLGTKEYSCNNICVHVPIQIQIYKIMAFNLSSELFNKGQVQLETLKYWILFPLKNVKLASVLCHHK